MMKCLAGREQVARSEIASRGLRDLARAMLSGSTCLVMGRCSPSTAPTAFHWFSAQAEYRFVAFACKARSTAADSHGHLAQTFQ